MKDNKRQAQERKAVILKKQAERNAKKIDSRKIHDTKGKNKHSRYF